MEGRRKWDNIFKVLIEKTKQNKTTVNQEFRLAKLINEEEIKTFPDK